MAPKVVAPTAGTKTAAAKRTNTFTEAEVGVEGEVGAEAADVTRAQTLRATTANGSAARHTITSTTTDAPKSARRSEAHR